MTFTNNPASFVADDSIHWDQFGNGVSVPVGSYGTTTLGNPFIVLTDTLAINDTLYRGPATTGNTFDPVSVSLHLNVPVSAIGANLVPTWTSFGYTVSMDVYTTTADWLGSVSQHYD
ncbi:MAG TPA: hypothetical protein VG820_09235, partial [Fimbriimonadaceae bacterium]|nr:hypothetical protein [Fimbriimonadaceae bacterium]